MFWYAIIQKWIYPIGWLDLGPNCLKVAVKSNSQKLSQEQVVWKTQNFAVWCGIGPKNTFKIAKGVKKGLLKNVY